jgi:hypothetical protein
VRAAAGGVGGTPLTMAGVCGDGLRSGVGGQQQRAHRLELHRCGMQRGAVVGGQRGGVRGRGGARGPPTFPASSASRPASVRSPKQTAVCNATTSTAGWCCDAATCAAWRDSATASRRLPSAPGRSTGSVNVGTLAARASPNNRAAVWTLPRAWATAPYMALVTPYPNPVVPSQRSR